MLTDIYGGKNLKDNAKIFLSILKGNGTAAQNNVVLANAALAISRLCTKFIFSCFRRC
jgi:anthranilate phosphoribosyltransferase